MLLKKGLCHDEKKEKIVCLCECLIFEQELHVVARLWFVFLEKMCVMMSKKKILCVMMGLFFQQELHFVELTVAWVPISVSRCASVYVSVSISTF